MTRTNATTQAIVRHLNYSGFVAWRNNNGAIYDPTRKSFRKSKTTLKGVFDIVGFRISDGKHLEIEIKTGKDKLSYDQIIHLEKLISAKCIAFVVKTFDDYIEMIEKSK